MISALDYPLGVFAIAILTQCLAAYAGDRLRRRGRTVSDAERTDFAIILPASLTLLGVIIGFSFSMAVTRYDQRKNYEEAEANAIGTEYVRADLLPAADAARVRASLRQYIDQRVAYYEERGSDRLTQAETETIRLQAELWSIVTAAARTEPTPVLALAVSGMNDVLNSHGYTQAAWRNRIPLGAWGLMMLVAAACNLLLGYSERRRGERILLVLPLIVSLSLFLIADIDSPRGGVIRLAPHNLMAVSKSLKAP